MPALLLEIGCEELPASALEVAVDQLPGLCKRHLGATPDEVYAGPRRLAVLLAELPERAADERRRGPGEGIAFDPDGSPTRAAEGFARGLGLAVEDLERGDGYVWGRVAGAPLRETLPERVAALVGGFGFAKPMAWEVGGLRFARPVRWLCVKLDAETVVVALDGVPAGGHTYGHRFTHDDPIELPSAGAYAEALRSAGVEPDAAERRRLIVRGLDALGAWSDPAGKLDEVVHLVEWPTVLEGAFAERFLRLPERVVVVAMQSHQRYFPLGPGRFAFVANGGDADVVRAGNERVLEGRLEDASFTFDRDVKVGIEGLAGRLGSIRFVARAGSFADKAQRLERLVEALGGDEDAKTAARLAKADQAAELVREFPELEGHVGAEYARLAGLSERVCRAIEEHYLPDAAGGPIPGTPAGRALAAVEKVDNLTVAFALGQRPTGSRDPYGLRRAAIGLCRLALEGGLELDVRALAGAAHGLLVHQGADVPAEPPPDVADFVEERLEQLLDVRVEAVRAARGAGLRDLGAIADLARALADAAGGELLEHTREVYERAARIASKADGAAERLRADLLLEDAEVNLAARLEPARTAIAGAIAERDFARGILAASQLRDDVELFFEQVLVMSDDPALRANRLRLLLDLRDVVGQLGDLSQLPS